MNKKLFIGATVVTTVAVAGVVYYRHVLAEEWKKLQGEVETDPYTQGFLEPTKENGS